MFDATARNGIASQTEKQDMPACLPLVSFFTGSERAGMRFEQFQLQVEDGDILISQDGEYGEYGEHEDVIRLSPDQVDFFIEQLRAAATKAKGQA